MGIRDDGPQVRAIDVRGRSNQFLPGASFHAGTAVPMSTCVLGICAYNHRRVPSGGMRILLDSGAAAASDCCCGLADTIDQQFWFGGSEDDSLSGSNIGNRLPSLQQSSCTTTTTSSTSSSHPTHTSPRKAAAASLPPPSFQLAPNGTLPLGKLIAGLGGRPCRLALNVEISAAASQQWQEVADRSGGVLVFDRETACVMIRGDEQLARVVFYGAATEGGATLDLAVGGRLARTAVMLPPNGGSPEDFVVSRAACGSPPVGRVVGAAAAVVDSPQQPRAPRTTAARLRSSSSRAIGSSGGGSSSGSSPHSPHSPRKLATASLPPLSFQLSPDGSILLSTLIAGLNGRPCRLALSAAPSAPAVAAAAHMHWRLAAQRSDGVVTYGSDSVLIAGREDLPCIVFYAQLAEGGAVVDLAANGAARVRTRVVLDNAIQHSPRGVAPPAASGLASAVAAARGSGALKAAVVAALQRGAAVGRPAPCRSHASSGGGGNAPHILASRQSRS